METILCGVDGSEQSYRALAWAAEEARVHHATLRVVHTWFEPFINGPFSAPAMYDPDIIRDAAQDVLDAAIATLPQHDADLVVEPVLAHGMTATVLLHEAEMADLLVVGSRGLGGFKELMLGSVSHQLVQHAPCPVAIIR